MTQPEISLSFRSICKAQFIGSLVVGLLWVAAAYFGGFSAGIILTGPAVSATLFSVSWVVLILFSPQKMRPVATVATLWSATSFVRFLIALGVAILLYYAARLGVVPDDYFGPRPLLLSFLLNAVFVLVLETKVVTTELAAYRPPTNDS